MNLPLPGDGFPEMNAQTPHGEIDIPGDLKGTWFVLFSHPADFTPVCTTEFIVCQKRFEEFEKMDCKLIGDRNIVPPAKDEKTAKERLADKSIECSDWRLDISSVIL